MSVIVKRLTKSYGNQKAVDELSFSVEKGEILGFLGPNGAGKSTTMRILTGFLTQDSGEAIVNGHNTRKEPLAVKKSIGYLPENNPLYPDLYVREYLQMICRIQRVPQANDRVAEVIGRTGLAREVGKKIGALSKGFRQRVGLAQALINNPDVLILDEPTSGLDPNQLVEIRSLIKSLGREKTVIFSTHIMQEVQAICSRVLIIHRGKMALDEPIGFLSARMEQGQIVTVTFDKGINMDALRAADGVAGVEKLSGNCYVVKGDGGPDIRPQIFQYAVGTGAVILEMFEKQETVEDVFHILTREQE